MGTVRVAESTSTRAPSQRRRSHIDFRRTFSRGPPAISYAARQRAALARRVASEPTSAHDLTSAAHALVPEEVEPASSK